MSIQILQRGRSLFMEERKVINPGLAIWVIESSLYQDEPQIWKVDGIAIDGEYGFGNNCVREFDGEVVLLSHEEKLVENLSIYNAHFSREGFKWLLKTNHSVPKTPFLISSDLAIKIIYDGLVEINKDDELAVDEGYIHPVGSQDWFGVMRTDTNRNSHLLAFSSKENVTLKEYDYLWSFEWDCPIGRIKII